VIREEIQELVVARFLKSSTILEESESSIGDETDDWRIQAMERLSVIPCFHSWIVYLKQEVSLPGIALAFFYFTVLRWIFSVNKVSDLECCALFLVFEVHISA
jgi:Ferroportin1 (FPN1)